MRRVLLTALILSPVSIGAHFEAARGRYLERRLPVWADVEWFVLAADGKLETWNPQTRVHGRNAASTVLEFQWTINAATSSRV